MTSRFAAIWIVVVAALAAACSAEPEGVDAATPAPTSAVAAEAGPDGALTPKPDATAPDAAADAKSDAQNDATLDVKSDATTDATTDANDASKDTSAETSAPTGASCAADGLIESLPCGVCGKRQRLCLNVGNGPVWQEWGSCSGEVPNGCAPGTTEYMACGMCGQKKRECTSTCTWITGICGNEPLNACEPGLVEYSDGLSCSAGTGRTRECSKPSTTTTDGGVSDGGVSGCTWSPYSSTCVAPITSLVAPATVGEKVGGVFSTREKLEYIYENYSILEAGAKLCKQYTTSYKIPGTYVQVTNPSTKTVTVSVWASESKAGTLANADVTLAAFPGATPPADLTACSAIGDYCGYSSCTGVPTSALAAIVSTSTGGAPVIAPGGTVTIYVTVDDYYTPMPNYDFALFVQTDVVK
jgi:hypothetical protein